MIGKMIPIFSYNNGNLLSISSSASGINNSTSFTYNYGLLTSISHHGVKVNYTYDGLGRKTVVALNDEEVMWNQYFDDYNSKNDSNYSFDREIKQGNYQDSTTLDGLFSASYTNYKGQVLYTKYSGDESVGESSYFYDEDKVSSTTSMITYRDNNQTYKEESLNSYNEFKQLVKQEKKVDDNSQIVLKDYYDDTNRFITSSDVILSDDEYRLNYLNEYDEEHRLTSITIREGIIDDEEFFTDMEKVLFKYDVLNRVIHNDISTEKMSLCHEYSYLQQDENTLDLIAEDITKIKVVNQGNTTYLTETSTYQYDVSGNITKIITDEDETRYTYDKLNRLIREDNPTLNKTITYKYDKAGNILLKKTYAYTLEGNLFSPTVDEYVYDCEGVRDRLISFNNKTIEYDSMGRPTTYKDDQYEWNNQGQLTYILKQNMDEISYLYDTNGIRRKKIVNGVKTSFITNETQILSMKQGSMSFIFRYNLNKLVGFNYNNGSSTKEYIYHRNIQGDILGIYDDEGNQVGGYAYDAYGHHVVTLDINGIATLNPFRYRGYFYDEETKLYYLNARYYDPETGRFISPDILSILDETKGQINGLNLYMYCGDNPVMRVDQSGCFWDILLDIGFLIWGIVDVIENPNDWKNWVALGIDILFMVTPFLSGGGGRIIKAGNMSDDINDIVKTINAFDDISDLRKVTIVGRNMDRVKDTAKVLNVTNNIYVTWEGYDKVKKTSKTLANFISLAHNGRWLLTKLRRGYTVIDLGLTATRKGRGLWYGIETIILRLWETRGIWKLPINYFL